MLQPIDIYVYAAAHEAALRRMISVWHQSTARADRKHRIRLLSYGSRGTVMSSTDHSAQRRFKSNNTPVYKCLRSADRTAVMMIMQKVLQ